MNLEELSLAQRTEVSDNTRIIDNTLDWMLLDKSLFAESVHLDIFKTGSIWTAAVVDDEGALISRSSESLALACRQLMIAIVQRGIYSK